MNIRNLLVLVCLLLLPNPQSAVAQGDPIAALRQVVDATGSAKVGEWRYASGDIPGAEQVGFDDSAWKVGVPDFVWGEERIGWVRTKIVLPADVKAFPVSGRVTLNLSVDDDGEAYVDGKLVHKFHWDTGQVVLTESAKAGQAFVVAVRIINTAGPGRLAAASLTFNCFDPARHFLEDYDFSVAMSDFNPGTRGPGYKEALAKAAAAVDSIAAERGDTDALLSSVQRASVELEPFRQAAAAYTCHLIGHAHIDMNWLWLWPETVDVCRNTFTSVTDLMADYPDFTFSQSQPTAYIAVQETAPELFAKIRTAVEKEKWEITGGTWVEGDMNLASGESIVRQILYARKYFRDTFGKEPGILWAPDTFGEAWTIPQIMKKSGLKYFVFVRCAPGPRLFWWQGPDGSRVLAFSSDGYGGIIDDGVPQRTISLSNEMNSKDTAVIYGVGDHGGGPTRADIVHAYGFEGRTVLPKIKFSSAGDFFAAVENQSDIPVVNNEINFTFPGCYTSHSDIKLMNRRSENLLPTAEAFAAVAGMYGRPYPGSQFRKSWQMACFNQFHDLLGGTAIHGAYDYSKGLFDQIEKQASGALTGSLRRIAGLVDTRRAGVPVVVFNPLAWARTDLVETADPFPHTNAQLSVIDSSGRTFPAQRTNGGVAFVARDVPALGYSVYWVRRGHATPDSRSRARAVSLGGRLRMENEYLVVEVSKSTGAIVRLFDKRARREVLEPGKSGSVLQALSEAHVDMSAWEIGKIKSTTDLSAARGIEILRQGPASCVIRVRHSLRDSSFTQDITLNAGVPRVDIHMKADWREAGTPEKGSTMLKTAFAVNVTGGKATFEMPFGSIERKADGSEVPALKWSDLSNSDYGVSLLNDCKYGHDINGNTLRLTLLRSPYDPDPRADVGVHTMTYSLYPHAGGWQDAGTARRAYELNNPLIAVRTGVHPGPFASHCSFVEVGLGDLIVTAFKRAEEGKGTILRFYNSSGRGTEAVIRLKGNFRTWAETNLTESPLNSEVQEIWNRTIRMPVGKWEIKTLLLK